jgi:dihydrofolate reductase
MSNTPGTISVRLAMSLDGYIAGHDGGYDWIVPVPSPKLDTAHQFLAADAVDMLTIGIVPVLLGDGRPLFPGEHPAIKLCLTDYVIADGKVRLVYQRR